MDGIIGDIEETLKNHVQNFADFASELKSDLSKLQGEVDERDLEKRESTIIEFVVDNLREKDIVLDMLYIFEKSKVAKFDYEKLEQVLLTIKKQING